MNIWSSIAASLSGHLRGLEPVRHHGRMSPRRKWRGRTLPIYGGFGLLECRRMLAAIAWTGLGNATSWSDPHNWSSGTLPSSGNDVIINLSGAIVTQRPVADSIKSLTSSDANIFSTGSLSIAGDSLISGDLTFSGGTIVGAGKSRV